MENPHYIPGVCNIGEAEIKQRAHIGWIGLGVTVIAVALLEIFHAPTFLKLFIIFPASFGATGFLQSWMHFCAGFGMQGVFNFSEELRKTDTVSQAAYRAQDRRKAISIFIYSLLIGVAITAAACIWK